MTWPDLPIRTYLRNDDNTTFEVCKAFGFPLRHHTQQPSSIGILLKPGFGSVRWPDIVERPRKKVNALRPPTHIKYNDQTPSHIVASSLKQRMVDRLPTTRRRRATSRSEGFFLPKHLGRRLSCLLHPLLPRQCGFAFRLRLDLIYQLKKSHKTVETVALPHHEPWGLDVLDRPGQVGRQ
ncbi:hypothetical protein LY76DRAFT_276562 [Colletotrichum caudatum]|nr:hypothetical protein LY76DRAFT_276562 [Colletotrichum caudatum]